MSSWDEHQCENYGELDEYDGPIASDGFGSRVENKALGTGITNSVSAPRGGSRTLSSLSHFSELSMDFGELQEDMETKRYASGSMFPKNRKKKSPNTTPDRPLRTKSFSPSEASIDLNELGDAIGAGEDLSNNRVVAGSMNKNGRKTSLSDGTRSFSSWHQPPAYSNNLIEDDEDDSSGCGNYLSFGEDCGDSTVRFDQVPLDLSTVIENDGSECSISIEGMTRNLSSLNNSNGSTGGSSVRRRVKFEISTRLENILEFDKPDAEDFHLLYYTAHELQKMIDNNRAKEKRGQDDVR